MNPSATELGLLSPAVKPASPKFSHASGEKPLPGYTIKRGVGWGGFGEVYYATTDAGKECALKFIRRNLEIELRGVTQCLNLKHPNLVALFDIRKDERDDTWVIMEFVSGESLEALIARHPHGIPMPEAMRWFEGLTAGVAYLHDHGIVHRDLKPGNIFSDEGIVKVGDYGLSKFISCSRRSGQTESVGTVHYMAPEIANGRYGKEIDIYALGVILYEMITGHVPFDGESVGEVLMKHLTAEPNVDKLAEPFRTVVARALSKNPEQRIRSVAEMRELLAVAMPAADRYGSQPTSTLPPADRPSTANLPPLYDPILAEPVVDAGAAKNSAYSLEGDNPFREPIARAVYEGGRRLRWNWERVDLPHPAKVLILVAATIAVLFTFPWVFMALLFLAPAYGVYWVIRALFVPPEPFTPPVKKPSSAAPPVATPPRPNSPRSSTPVAAQPVMAETSYTQPAMQDSTADDALTRRERLQRRRARAEASTEPKSIRQKTTEATGAMLFAAVLSLAFSVVANLLAGQHGPEERQFVWLAGLTMLGAWAVIVPSKVWEGHSGDAIGRRSCMLILGMIVGLAAYALTSGFSLAMPYGDVFGMPNPLREGMGPINRELYDSAGKPGLWAHAAYFAFLFLVPAWWRQGDANRRYRVSFWTVVTMTAWGYLLSFFWTYPQPWGMLVAGGVSLVTQLASTHRDRYRRPDHGEPNQAELAA